MLSLCSSLFLSCGEKRAQVPFYNSADYTPVWSPSDKERLKMHVVPAFNFSDQHGEHLSSAQLKGKVYVANFFFTSCKGICPKMTNNIRKVYERYKESDDVLFLSFSVTPEIDSIPRLKSFAEQNGIQGRQWRFLTGPSEQIYTLARRGYFIEEANGLSKDSTEFLHTENIVLVDGEGHLRGLYNGTIPLEAGRIIEDIGALLEERRR